MAITNISRPNSSISNTSRANIGETWASIPTTWASETRAWIDMSSLISNTILVAVGLIWSTKRFPWTETLPWITEGGISNVAKPL